MMPSSRLTNTKLKIVVDTNQFLSVFVFRGQMTKLVFELVLDNKIDLYISPALKEEVEEKLQFFHVGKEVQDDVFHFINEKGILITPTIQVTVSTDKDDNFNLELAETVQADYVITRDHDLLDIKQWKQTKIISPEVFLPILRKLHLLK